MGKPLQRLSDLAIEYGFYALIFFVPIVFSNTTSELFELNKMWLTWALTIVIVCFWIIKMILSKQVRIQKTPLDIPILLFLLSQIVSTVFSIDRHVSLWGYYSRFNGGLLSTISYITLYYALVSNFQFQEEKAGSLQTVWKVFPINQTLFRLLFCILASLIVLLGFYFSYPKSATDSTNSFVLSACFFVSFLLFAWSTSGLSKIKRLLYVTIISGIVVLFWGLPSHFGHDPTCLLLRGSFDVNCWTESFKPELRMFSTLGQPNWLAAYVAILIPSLLALVFKKAKNVKRITVKRILPVVFYLLLSFVFFLSLLYTNSRSGFLAVLGGIVVFFLLQLLLLLKLQKKALLGDIVFIVVIIAAFAFISLFEGTPYTGPLLKSPPSQKTHQVQGPALETGGTESGAIRKIVWTGAFSMWEHYPLFGTGVETFAFSYYQFRPAAHNTTSEWDFLYNKAHNEYLNYLATTGLFGFLSYILMIGVFLFTVSKKLLTLRILEKDYEKWTLTIGLVSGYVTILLSNFPSFSVVVTNLFLFLIPGFVVILLQTLSPNSFLGFGQKPNQTSQKESLLSLGQCVLMIITVFLSLYLLFTLFTFLNADKAYALGYTLDRAGQYPDAYASLKTAVALRSDEPVFKDELSFSQAALAILLSSNKQATKASDFAKGALQTSDEITTQYPYNISFLKTRVRILALLGETNDQFFQLALSSIQKASVLAPTDAKVFYTMGVLYGKVGNTKKAVETLQKTVVLKSDYRDAHYALGLYYDQLAKSQDLKTVARKDLEEKAIYQMRYILSYLVKDDKDARAFLKEKEGGK